jgi:hypothetical protein
LIPGWPSSSLPSLVSVSAAAWFSLSSCAAINFSSKAKALSFFRDCDEIPRGANGIISERSFVRIAWPRTVDSEQSVVTERKSVQTTNVLLPSGRPTNGLESTRFGKRDASKMQDAQSRDRWPNHVNVSWYDVICKLLKMLSLQERLETQRAKTSLWSDPASYLQTTSFLLPRCLSPGISCIAIWSKIPVCPKVDMHRLRTVSSLSYHRAPQSITNHEFRDLRP